MNLIQIERDRVVSVIFNVKRREKNPLLSSSGRLKSQDLHPWLIA